MKKLKTHNLGKISPALAFFAIASCSAPHAVGINDPYEEANRKTHASNRMLDRKLIKPASGAYGAGLPQPVRQGIGNFASNLGLPGVVVNNLLQLNLKDALKNSTRFFLNTTIGVGGLLDPSTAMGLHEESSDFGETLHVWGVGEGNYVELPFIGPSTERDMAGMVVDLFTNPLSFGASGAGKLISPAAKGLSKLGDRYEFSDTIDTILYDSADSYAQARLLYLQHRRFELGQELSADALVKEGEEAYEDFYAE